MLNAALLWPLSLGLFLTGVETLHWDRLPWPALLSASCLSLGNHTSTDILKGRIDDLIANVIFTVKLLILITLPPYNTLPEHADIILRDTKI